MRKKTMDTLDGLGLISPMRTGRTAASKGLKGAKSEQKDRKRRMKWWHEARFGMFIHYGLFSQLARGECVMYWDRIPAKKSSEGDESRLSAQGISGRKAGILPANDIGNVTSN